MADLYRFTPATFEGLEGFGGRSVANLLGAIDESQARPLSRVLIGLGIRHLGPGRVPGPGAGVRTLDAVLRRRWPALAAVDGVGPVIAASVVASAASGVNRTVVGGSHEAGVEPHRARRRPGAGGDAGVAQTLAGKSVVVTGTLEGYTREEAEEAILARGGKSPGTVSKRTFAVVVGDAPGASKVPRPRSSGIPVVDGAGFAALLDTGELPDRRC